MISICCLSSACSPMIPLFAVIIFWSVLASLLPEISLPFRLVGNHMVAGGSCGRLKSPPFHFLVWAHTPDYVVVCFFFLLQHTLGLPQTISVSLVLPFPRGSWPILYIQVTNGNHSQRSLPYSWTSRAWVTLFLISGSTACVQICMYCSISTGMHKRDHLHRGYPCLVCIFWRVWNQPILSTPHHFQNTSLLLHSKENAVLTASVKTHGSFMPLSCRNATSLSQFPK